MAVKIIGFIATWALLVALQTAAQPSQQPTASDANLVGMADRVTESRYEWKVWRNKNWLLKDCTRMKCPGYSPFGCLIGITVKKQCEQLGTVDYGRAKFSEAGFIKYCQKKCQANDGCNAINYIRFPEKEEKQPLCQLLKCPQPFPDEPEVKASPAKDKNDNGDCYWNSHYGQDSSGDAYALERNKDYTFQ